MKLAYCCGVGKRLKVLRFSRSRDCGFHLKIHKFRDLAYRCVGNIKHIRTGEGPGVGVVSDPFFLHPHFELIHLPVLIGDFVAFISSQIIQITDWSSGFQLCRKRRVAQALIKSVIPLDSAIGSVLIVISQPFLLFQRVIWSILGTDIIRYIFVGVILLRTVGGVVFDFNPRITVEIFALGFGFYNGFFAAGCVSVLLGELLAAIDKVGLIHIHPFLQDVHITISAGHIVIS